MRQYLTYQHNVQRFFLEHSDKYDGVIIPMSIATSFPTGTYGFIRALFSQHADIEYSIDPRNALFQKHWDRSNVRPPHEKMAQALGKPYTTEGLSRALVPTDFENAEVLKENVKQCIEFQEQFSNRTENERKLNKYKKLLGLNSLAPLKKPQHFIPPYYQFSGFSDPWYQISMRSIQASLEYQNKTSVRPVMHFTSWGNLGDWETCFSDLNTFGIRSIWFYPNNFKEHDASAEELKAYRSSVMSAVNSKLEPFCLFGGYFAVLMSYFGLSGFGNGVGYGEWRDSGYHRGGSASTRIYMLKLHRYVDAPKAQSLIDGDPEYFGNDSEIVSGYVESEKSVVDMSLQESLDHFMECRKQELVFAQSHSIDDAKSELEITISKLNELGPLEYEKFGKSLECWLDAIG